MATVFSLMGQAPTRSNQSGSNPQPGPSSPEAAQLLGFGEVLAGGKLTLHGGNEAVPSIPSAHPLLEGTDSSTSSITDIGVEIGLEGALVEIGPDGNPLPQSGETLPGSIALQLPPKLSEVSSMNGDGLAAEGTGAATAKGGIEDAHHTAVVGTTTLVGQGANVGETPSRTELGKSVNATQAVGYVERDPKAPPSGLPSPSAASGVLSVNESGKLSPPKADQQPTLGQDVSVLGNRGTDIAGSAFSQGQQPSSFSSAGNSNAAAESRHIAETDPRQTSGANANFLNTQSSNTQSVVPGAPGAPGTPGIPVEQHSSGLAAAHQAFIQPLAKRSVSGTSGSDTQISFGGQPSTEAQSTDRHLAAGTRYAETLPAGSGSSAARAASTAASTAHVGVGGGSQTLASFASELELASSGDIETDTGVKSSLLSPAQNSAQGAKALPQLTISQPVGHSPGWEQAMAGRIVWMGAQGVQSANLTLNPQDLGAIQIQVDISGDQANVQFQAQSAETCDLIEKLMPRLSHALEGQGLKLEDSKVTQFTAFQDFSSAQQAANQSAGRQGGDGTQQQSRPGAASSNLMGQEPSEELVQTLVNESSGGVDYYA